jgi:hypothetical protein
MDGGQAISCRISSSNGNRTEPKEEKVGRYFSRKKKSGPGNDP